MMVQRNGRHNISLQYNLATLRRIRYGEKTTSARKFIVHLQANSKPEYQEKIRALYQYADELQKKMGVRVVLWMKDKNIPGTFSQIWELIVTVPYLMTATTEEVEY